MGHGRVNCPELKKIFATHGAIVSGQIKSKAGRNTVPSVVDF